MNNAQSYAPAPLIRMKDMDENVKDSLVTQGVDQWTAEILSRRFDDTPTLESIFSPSLKKVPDPAGISSIGMAVERIIKAINEKERIVLACDHDMDGTASAAVLWKAFTEYFNYPSEYLHVITSHRLTEGYGITMPVVTRILKTGATLIITADKGSSDEKNIKVLKDAGRDVIVTDHHAIPVEGPPKSAYATVNPISSDSDYDSNICGAAVAFLVMAKVRRSLIDAGLAKKIPSMAGLLDYVAVATISDCVSMRPDRSYVNRAFVKKGLQLINKKTRPCWVQFLESMKGPVRTEDISYQLAPPIAAAGRLDWAESGFLFLIADSISEAQKHWGVLKGENKKRKMIEKDLRDVAMPIALSKSNQSIIVYIEDGHSGVHGITASRLVQALGKPVGIFSPKGAGVRTNELEPSNESAQIASGSFRGIPGFHVRDCLQYVADHYPKLLIKFGGHAGAAGATIAIKDISDFEQAFEEGTIKQLGNASLRPIIDVDCELPGSRLNLEMLESLGEIEPWGKDFPPPTFIGEFVVESFKSVGDGSHLSFVLNKDGVLINAIWFNAVGNNMRPIKYYEGDKVTFVYKLTDNWFRGRRSAQLIIEAVDSVD